jgi:hypothetical protein
MRVRQRGGHAAERFDGFGIRPFEYRAARGLGLAQAELSGRA